MSTKTFSKRLALIVIGAIGFGFLPATSSQAALQADTISLSSATATVNVGDSATVTLTHTFSHTLAEVESSTVRYTCVAPSGQSCPALQGYQAPTADTANITIANNVAEGWINLSSANARSGTGPVGWTDSSTATSTASSKSTVSLKAVEFGGAGSYVYTLYTQAGNLGTSSAISSSTITWSVTVAAPNTTGTALSRFYLSADQHTAKTNRVALGASSDSAITTAAGLATAPAIVGYAFITTANSAGDTRVAVGSSFRTVDESITVTVSGPGLVSSVDASGGATPTKSAVLNSRGGATLGITETLTIFSDGTAGTSTITFSNRTGAVLKTATVTFTGAPASAAIAFSDTIVSLTAGTTVVGTVRDSGGNVMKSGTVYIFSTDTNIAGANLSTNVHPIVATAYTIPSTGVLAFPLTTANRTNGLETGVATITLRDSWTVAASTWSSNAIDVTVTSNKIATLTVAFDKATYAPGERAVITYTATDIAGRALATAAVTGLTATSNATMTDVTTASITGTNAGTGVYTVLGSGFSGFADSGVETRVVTMPTYGTKVTLTNTFAKFGSTTGELTSVVAEATVVDPNATAIAANNAAIAAAQAASVAAAEAATDAAAEAIDAANAATDAANLAAEAADAATVAAEEARDAADAATAAVEELATQVATLMAALKAQITTLANTVAKIAKKVKA